MPKLGKLRTKQRPIRPNTNVNADIKPAFELKQRVRLPWNHPHFPNAFGFIMAFEHTKHGEKAVVMLPQKRRLTLKVFTSELISNAKHVQISAERRQRDNEDEGYNIAHGLAWLHSQGQMKPAKTPMRTTD